MSGICIYCGDFFSKVKEHQFRCRLVAEKIINRYKNDLIQEFLPIVKNDNPHQDFNDYNIKLYKGDVETRKKFNKRAKKVQVFRELSHRHYNRLKQLQVIYGDKNYDYQDGLLELSQSILEYLQTKDINVYESVDFYIEDREYTLVLEDYDDTYITYSLN